MNPWNQDIVITLRFEATQPHQREQAFLAALQTQQQHRLRQFARRQWFLRTQRRTRSRFVRLLPSIFITFGSIVLANALWPIISYFVFTSPDLQVPQLVSALPNVPVVYQSETIPQAQAAGPAEIKPKIIRNSLDYTNLTNWFPEGGEVAATFETIDPPSVDRYLVSIPSLDIEDAEVQIGGTNLDDNLIQYPGTADPGELGAPVIFGHSVLRQFYNPSIKNPRRYISIFSKIMTLKSGERIHIEYDGITYIYEVKEKAEVKPEDVYILQQDYSARLLKLVTCVPEGTYLRRGVVTAELVTVDSAGERTESAPTEAQ